MGAVAGAGTEVGEVLGVDVVAGAGTGELASAGVCAGCGEGGGDDESEGAEGVFGVEDADEGGWVCLGMSVSKGDGGGGGIFVYECSGEVVGYLSTSVAELGLCALRMKVCSQHCYGR